MNNNRIKDLVDEAMAYANYRVAITDDKSHIDVFAAKFAELMLNDFYALIYDQKLSFHYLEEQNIVNAFYEFEDIVNDHFMEPRENTKNEQQQQQ